MRVWVVVVVVVERGGRVARAEGAGDIGDGR
jgi:hypothetical protein